MVCFHGTVTRGLTKLMPFASEFSNLKEPLVYLTTNRQLALHYIWDTDRLGIKMPMLDIREDGVLVFQEMFSGALEYLYKGVSGYVYRCTGEFEINPNTGVFSCVTSREAVPVTDFEYIDDVYESIVSYIDKGTFIYERYEELPQWRIDVIRGNILRFIRRNSLLSNPSHPSFNFIREKFPGYWQEAQVLDTHGLL